ncbi:MAG: PDZ domain-containing protein [Gemmataceae bacterium]
MGVVPGYLGVRSDDAEKEGGAKVTSLTEGAPAEKAGLKANDVVTAVDGKPVKKADDFSAAIQGRKPGETITITVTRDGKPLTIQATLGEPPDLQAGNRRTLDFKTEEGQGGVVVRGVFPGGPSAEAGLQAGDVVTAIDKQKVTQSKQVIEAFRAAKPGNKVVLTAQRGKETKQLAVVVPDRGTRRTPPRPYAFFYGGQRENVQDRQGPEGPDYGGVYKSTDGGETWARVNSVNPRPMYFSQVRVDPTNDKTVYVLGIRMYRSEDGGKTFKTGVDAKTHDDQHALWIDPRDGRHLMLGTDGGTYVTYNRCQHWDYLNTTSIGQFYHVCVDSRKPYRVYGGMQDNGSWGGPSMALDGNGPINADWVMVQGGDGFVCRVDPSDPDIVYSESQEGRMNRTNLKTGEQSFISPRTPRGQPPYRFNWNAPMVVSSHNPAVFYCAGNYVFRSIKRGDEAKRISPELVKTSQASATALAESPKNADVLWAGTDDGNLWVTKDGGANWVNVAAKVGLPRPYWVATVEPSRTVEGRCYVCFDGHRSDNDDPHVYVTENFGETWKSLRGNLPSGSSRVLREDFYNPDVLYLGTEFAVWASIDRGATWTRINNNLPTVAVHELAQHPTAGEMVAATHGRGLWVLDVSPLRQLKPAMAKADATLLAPNTAVRWRRELRRGTIYGAGHRDYFGDNPAPGGHVYYALTKKVSGLRLEVQDYTGKRVATLPAKNEPGLHRVTWNLRGSATGVGLEALLPTGFMNAMMRGQQAAPPGQYRVVLTADKKEQVVGLRLENDPTLPPTTILADPPPGRKAKLGPED